MTEKNYLTAQRIAAGIALVALAGSFSGIGGFPDASRFVLPFVAILALLFTVSLELRKRASRQVLLGQAQELANWRGWVKDMPTVILFFVGMGVGRAIAEQVDASSHITALLAVFGGFAGVVAADIALHAWKFRK